MGPDSPTRPERFSLMSQPRVWRGRSFGVRFLSSARPIAAVLALVLLVAVAWTPAVSAAPVTGDVPAWSVSGWLSQMVHGILAGVGLAGSESDRGDDLERITAPEGTVWDPDGGPSPGALSCEPPEVCPGRGAGMDPAG